MLRCLRHGVLKLDTAVLPNLFVDQHVMETLVSFFLGPFGGHIEVNAQQGYVSISDQSTWHQTEGVALLLGHALHVCRDSRFRVRRATKHQRRANSPVYIFFRLVYVHLRCDERLGSFSLFFSRCLSILVTILAVPWNVFLIFECTHHAVGETT